MRKENQRQTDAKLSATSNLVPSLWLLGLRLLPIRQKECAKYALTSDTIILLITAEELKNVAMKFAAVHQADKDSLPLGIFKQNGRFDPDLIVL